MLILGLFSLQITIKKENRLKINISPYRKTFITELTKISAGINDRSPPLRSGFDSRRRHVRSPVQVRWFPPGTPISSTT